MANEHLRTAATNIQRAVQDVRDAQRRIHGEIENVKRENAKAIDTINKQIAKLERNRFKTHLTAEDRVAIGAQEKALQAQISKIQGDTERYASEREREIHMFDGQAVEFEGLASHLNSIA